MLCDIRKLQHPPDVKDLGWISIPSASLDSIMGHETSQQSDLCIAIL